MYHASIIRGCNKYFYRKFPNCLTDGKLANVQRVVDTTLRRSEYMAPIIQVAIGLFFVFALLALLVTQTNTLISNLLNLRAKHLKEGLIRLISDQEVQAKLLAHPLIRLVEKNVPPSASLTLQQARSVIDSKLTQVTYIQPDTFVEALISLLSTSGSSGLFDAFEQVLEGLPDGDEKYKLREMLRDLQGFGTTDTSQLRAAVLELQDETHKQWLSYALEAAEDRLGTASVKSGQMIPLLEGIRRLKDRALQDAIKTILITAQNLDDARKKLESWFNDGMTRTTELYRRQIGWISFGVGLALAAILNVDTLQLGRSLWQDESLRQSVVAVAQTTTAQQSGGDGTIPGAQDTGSFTQNLIEAQKTVTQLLELNLPVGWELDVNYQGYLESCTQLAAAASEASLLSMEGLQPAPMETLIDPGGTPLPTLTPAPTPETVITTPEPTQLPRDEMIDGCITSLGLPDPRQNPRNVFNLIPGSSGDWFGNLLRKLSGILVTAIAAAQGAPFWFDLLKRLTGGSQSSSPSVVVNSPPVNVTVNRDETAQG
jgi:hypothetical protein